MLNGKQSSQVKSKFQLTFFFLFLSFILFSIKACVFIYQVSYYTCFYLAFSLLTPFAFDLISSFLEIITLKILSAIHLGTFNWSDEEHLMAKIKEEKNVILIFWWELWAMNVCGLVICHLISFLCIQFLWLSLFIIFFSRLAWKRRR